MKNNIKFYNNPQRKTAETYKEYVPQHVIHDRSPEIYHGGKVPTNILISKSTPLPLDNPRAPKMPMRQPYAVPETPPFGTGPIPNVGNNVEIGWAGYDGEIIDDLSEQIDPNHLMIDNNDYVNTQEFITEPYSNNLNLESNQLMENNVNLSNIIGEMEMEQYLVLISGEPIFLGSLDEAEKETRELVFGDHQICNGSAIPADQITILKKVKFKIGLFLE